MATPYRCARHSTTCKAKSCCLGSMSNEDFAVAVVEARAVQEKKRGLAPTKKRLVDDFKEKKEHLSFFLLFFFTFPLDVL